MARRGQGGDLAARARRGLRPRRGALERLRTCHPRVALSDARRRAQLRELVVRGCARRAAALSIRALRAGGARRPAGGGRDRRAEPLHGRRARASLRPDPGAAGRAERHLDRGLRPGGEGALRARGGPALGRSEERGALGGPRAAPPLASGAGRRDGRGRAPRWRRGAREARPERAPRGDVARVDLRPRGALRALRPGAARGGGERRGARALRHPDVPRALVVGVRAGEPARRRRARLRDQCARSRARSTGGARRAGDRSRAPVPRTDPDRALPGALRGASSAHCAAQREESGQKWRSCSSRTRS